MRSVYSYATLFLMIFLSTTGSAWANTLSEKAENKLQHTETTWQARCSETATPDTLRWAHARAVHDLTLDYSLIDLEPSSVNHLAKQYLSKAKFHIASSETAQILSGDVALAHKEFQLAQSYLEKARAAMDNENTSHIETLARVLSQLDILLQKNWSNCWGDQERQVFEALKLDLGNLLKTL